MIYEKIIIAKQKENAIRSNNRLEKETMCYILSNKATNEVNLKKLK